MNTHELASKLFIDVCGDGDPLLLVHGLGGTSNCWRPLIAEFEPIYQVFAPDMPSSGRSPIVKKLDITLMAQTMLTLLDAHNIQSTRLVGHSMGTIVCQHLAAMAPNRIHSMVLLGPIAEPPEPARKALTDRAALAHGDGITQIADAVSVGSLSAKTRKDNANVQGFVREMILAQSGQGYGDSCLALANAQRADATQISMPVCLITGDEDGVAPVANVEKLADALPLSEMHVLDHCGHWTLNEQPAATLAIAKKFFDKH